MKAYFLRRLLLTIPTFIGITMVVYVVIRQAPGGPIEQAKMDALKSAMNDSSSNGSGGAGISADTATMKSGGELSKEDKARLMKKYNISDNIAGDYFRWLGKIICFDFGRTNESDKAVLPLIMSKIPISLCFGLINMFLIYAICIPMGLAKAVKHQGFFDSASSIVVYFGYAIPGYALGALLIVVVAANWQLLPLGGFVSENFAELPLFARYLDLFKHMILPMCCYLVGAFAFMTMLIKNQIMENMAADYVRTALAKGVNYKTAIFKHAFENSLIPIATTFGNQISVMIAGSFLIESIFRIDGMGFLGFNSMLSRDYPIVMGVLAISAVLQLLGNIFSDLCVAYVDPRVKFS